MIDPKDVTMMLTTNKTPISDVVFITELTSPFRDYATIYNTFSSFIMQIIFIRNRIFSPIYGSIIYFSLLPNLVMVIMNMFRLITNKLQIFKPVIVANAIQMVNFLVKFKRSTQILFDYISMFKNSFTINSNSPIAVIVETSIFATTPVRIVLRLSIQIYKSLMVPTININRVSSAFSTTLDLTNHNYIIQHEGYKYND